MSNAPQYEIHPLNPAKHRRDEFTCESPELTEFLRKRARKEMDALASACFVLVALHDPGRIAGFYTLSAAEIGLADLPETFRRRLPRYPTLPATLLGRLARDQTFRGLGIGDLLMMDALRRALLSSRGVGSVAIVTDPKNDTAKTFYEGFGFQPLTGTRVFLAMTDVARLFSDF